MSFNKSTGLPVEPDVRDVLTRITDGSGITIGWDVFSAETFEVERYGVDGRLLTVTSREGRVLTFGYTDITFPSVFVPPLIGALTSVTDDNGQSLHFTYDTKGRMVTMTDPSGGVYTYRYEEPSSNVFSGAQPVGNLTSVTYPDGTSRIYWYNEQDKTGGTNLPFALTGITDERGVRFATYRYDSQGRAISTEHAGGVEKAVLVYNGSNSTQVTEYNDGGSTPSITRQYSFQDIGGIKRNTGISHAGASCGSAARATTYDGNGNVTSKTDFTGTVTTFAYDTTRNLETSRTVASGTPLARTTTTTWHPTMRLPNFVDEPGRRTTYGYDAKGLVTSVTVTDTATSTSRTTAYEYNLLGQLTQVNGPRTDAADITTITYYNCATGYQCGQVATVTNALGHTTTFNSYNAHGQPLSITDANGLITTMTYDARQRVTSVTAGTETTSYAYWPTGQLQQVTLPDGSTMSFTYDDAHRLIGISDTNGNRVAYNLDKAGNQLGTNVYDPANTLAFTSSRVFDGLNRVRQSNGAANQTALTDYDANSNVVSQTDPLNRVTSFNYDQLGRMVSMTDPALGVTQTGYNSRDDLTSVSDPRNLQTTYTYNALGDLVTQVSPDTSTTTHTYDSAGNLLTSTDARGEQVTFEYDALNRITEADYSDETTTYQYDQGANAAGRLTQVNDNSGSTGYTYTSQGRIASKTQTMAGVSKTLSYIYSNAGQLASVVTPSGHVVGYQYTNGQVTGLTLNSQSVINQITYAPFGPIKGWYWADGTQTARTYDLDGRITANSSAGSSTYTYNADNTIATRVDDTTEPLLLPTGTTTFDVSATSNRLNNAAGTLNHTYTYDSAGNTLSDGARTFTYDPRGRMGTSTSAGVTTSYQYNALGQRVRKSNASGTTYFVFDEAGHLMGEYDGAGALIQEIVWLGDIPVASIRPNENGTGVGVFFIHTDHLNAPTKLTRSTDGAIVWRWDHDPFGNGVPNEDPDGNGLYVAFNLRFPGQYADAETGLNYNYYRDYDPATGRYTTSDPIGLMGGINTYAYVGANPISYYDPYGLFGMDDVYGAIYNMTDGWSPSQGLVDFGAGLGDELTFGLTRRAREMFDIGSVNTCSADYRYGGYTGFAATMALGYGAGTKAAAKAASPTNWQNFSHSLFPDRWLKRFDNPVARWLNRTGNRLNGDHIPVGPRPNLHDLMDATAAGVGGKYPTWPAWRRAINRIPFVPGSAAYGAGSLAINNCGCE